MADEHRIAIPTRRGPAKNGDGSRFAGDTEGEAAPGPGVERTLQAGREALHALIAECYDAAMGIRPWERFLAQLSGVLDCTGAALMTQSTARSERWVLWSSGPLPDRVRGCREAGAAEGLGRRLSGHAVVECWFPQCIDRPAEDRNWPRCLTGSALHTQDEAIVLRAWRDRVAEPFNDVDHRLFTELVPHVGRALDIHWSRQLSSAEGGAVRSVLDRLGEAVFVIDREGRVVISNLSADSMIRRRCGWSIAGDRLVPAAAKDREAFRRIVDDVLAKDVRDDDARMVRLTLVGDDGAPPVPVAVTRLDRLTGTEHWRRPLAAVISRDPMRRAAVLTPELAKTYELTPSEARLAGMIVNGFSLIDAAIRLNISKNTARSHMKRIYVKTCTQNHADLVRTLSRSVLQLFDDGGEPIEAGAAGDCLN